MFAASDINLTYFIVNGTEEVDFQVWVNKINGCLPEVYKNYTEPRNYFCIDYRTGELFTTILFVTKRPWPATKYYLHLRADNKIKFTDQIFMFETMAQCKKLRKVYNEIANNKYCLKNTTVKLSSLDPDKTYKLLGNRKLRGGTLVALDINMSTRHDILKNLYQQVKEDIILTANIIKQYVVQSLTFTYNLHSGDVHHIYLKEPLLISEDMSAMKLKVYDESGAIDDELDFKNGSQNFVVFYYVLEHDYCGSDINKTCKKYTELYMNLENLMKVCRHFDVYMFQFKYGYCTGKSFVCLFVCI